MPIDKKAFDKMLLPKQTVLDFLTKKKETGEGYTPKEIADATGLTPREVAAALFQLLVDKKIEWGTKTGQDYYRTISES